LIIKSLSYWLPTSPQPDPSVPEKFSINCISKCRRRAAWNQNSYARERQKSEAREGAIDTRN